MSNFLSNINKNYFWTTVIPISIVTLGITSYIIYYKIYKKALHITPPSISSLLNSYYLVRHGKSQANIEGVICCDIEGCHGLCSKGRGEVRKCSQKLHDCLDFSRPTIIVSSDFPRAVQTSELIQNELKLSIPLIKDQRLRERNFGQWNNTSSLNYHTIWDDDNNDPNNTELDVESVLSVRQRMLQCLISLEKQYSGYNIILISHGDPLQILLTAFSPHLKANQHREIPFLESGSLTILSNAFPPTST